MLNNSYKKVVVDANGNKYESYKTIQYVHESPTSENSSNLQINNNKAIMTINSLELTGGATATTDDIIVTRSGKNLLDGNLRTTPKTQNGITIQYLPDEDCYLLNGTCTANTSHYLITHNLFVNGRITASMVVISGTCEGASQFSISYRDNLSETTFPLWVTKNIITGNLSINQGVHKYIGATWFYIAKGTSFNNYKIKIQIELGTVVTEYEPYLPPKSLTFSRDYLLSLKGVNNLLDKSKFLATQTKNGITFTNNGDGTITVNGTLIDNTVETYYIISGDIELDSTHKYLALGCPSGGSRKTFFMTDWGAINDIGNGIIFANRNLSHNLQIRILTTVSNLVFKPQLYDLTAIYGEGNEPTTVEQFLKDYPLSSTDNLTITKNSVKYNDTDITSEVTGLDEFMKTDTNTAIIDTNYAMGSISADVDYLYTSRKTEFYTEEV